MKKFYIILVAIPIHIWCMESHTNNNISCKITHTHTIDLDSNTDSSAEEDTPQHRWAGLFKNSHPNTPIAPHLFPRASTGNTGERSEESNSVIPSSRSILSSTSFCTAAQSSFTKKMIDQKLSQISCCGLKIGSWDCGLHHVMLAHVRGHNVFTCSACNKLYECAANTLGCIARHQDPLIFTCPSCMIDCVGHDALIKHVCPVLLPGIISVQKNNISLDQPFNSNANLSRTSTTAQRALGPHNTKNDPLPTVTGGVNQSFEYTDAAQPPSSIKPVSSTSEVIELEEPIAGCDQKQYAHFDPSLSIEKNLTRLYGIITKRLSEKRYHCCEEKDLTWKFFCKHVRRMHVIKKSKIKCPLCLKILTNFARGYEHIACHTYELLFACPLSLHQKYHEPFKTDSRHNLITHFKSCFDMQCLLLQRLVCFFCGQSFKTQSMLDEHLKASKKQPVTTEKKDWEEGTSNCNQSEKIATNDTPNKVCANVQALVVPSNSDLPANNNPLLNLDQNLNLHQAQVGLPSHQGFNFNATTNKQSSAVHTDKVPEKPHIRCDLKIIQYIPEKKTQRLSRLVVDAKPIQPVVVENHTFDAQGQWTNNLKVLNKIIAARLAQCSFTCCTLSNLSWRAFCDHQKEQHRQTINRKEKVVCPDCEKSYHATSLTHEHSATHQYPRIFCCPLCVGKEKQVNFELKESLAKHFKKCLLKTIVSLAEVEQVNQNPELITMNADKEKSSEHINNWIDQSVQEFHLQGTNSK